MKQLDLKCVVTAFLFLLLSSSFAQAEPSSAKKEAQPVPFKVVAHSLHVEAPKAEVCLSLSQPFDERDRAKIVANLSVKKDGKIQKITPEELSLTSRDLCVQGLHHRATYQLTLRGMKSKTDKPMASAYTVSFVVPDRKAALSFVDDGALFTLPRHVKKEKTSNEEKGVTNKVDGMAHVLRSVNILATHLTLYRFDDRAVFAGAWQQFKQAHLSPSESQTFAREKGKVVFESDLVFGDHPNEAQTLIAPLPLDEALTAGLYYLAATPRGQGGIAPSLFAGQWFLVSDLRAMATMEKEGVRVVVSLGTAAQGSAHGVSVALWTRDGNLIAEAKTKEDGSVLLPVKDKVVAFLVSAQSEAGALDIVEVVPSHILPDDEKEQTAALSLDRERYVFSKTVLAFLRLLSVADQGKGKEETVLKFFDPDNRLVYEQGVPPFDQSAVHVASVPLPTHGKAGLWRLSWQKKEGLVLAQETFFLSLADQAARVSVIASRMGGESSGSISLSVQTQDEKGNALPYREGSLSLSSARPSLEGWEAYRFGVMEAGQDDQAIRNIPFLTDGVGKASLSLDAASLEPSVNALSFKAVLDEGAESVPVTMPLWRTSPFIGLRAWPDERPLFQNGVAQFDVIAVDPSRKRVAHNDLYYVIYEEGRNFEWFPSEGSWDYKLLPHHRRVGGGALALMASGENRVSWPVATGRYLLEITNARGDVVARRGFEAASRSGQQSADAAWPHKTGGDAKAPMPAAAQTLGLKMGAVPVMTVGTPFVVSAHISAPTKPKPTMAMAVLSSDRPDGTVVTKPAVVDEDGTVTFHATPKGTGGMTLTVIAWQDKQWGKAGTAVEAVMPLQIAGDLPDVLRQGDRAPFSLVVANNAEEKGLYSYELTFPPYVTLTGATKGKIDFRKAKKQTLRLTLVAQGATDGLVRFKLTHPRGKIQEQTWPLRVIQEGLFLPSVKPFLVEPDKVFSRDQKAQALLVSPLPFSESLIESLVAFVQDEPQTTTELALWLEVARLWRQPLVGLGLLSEDSLGQLLAGREDDLESRQNGDGGFAVARFGEASDLASTVAAVKALPERSERNKRVALEWLEGKVKNTWFNEADRGAYALAFEALAQARRTDIAALRYFAETSQDKSLNAAVTASLARALRLGGDDAEAQRWMERAQKAFDDSLHKKAPCLMSAFRLLALDEKNNSDGLKEKLTRMPALTAQASFEDRASFLTGVALAALRMGSWRVLFHEKDDKRYGFSILTALSDGKKEDGLKNSASRPLYGLALLSHDRKNKIKIEAVGSIKRSVYRLDGEKIEEGMPLRVGEVYGLLLQGRGKKDMASPVKVTMPVSASFSAFAPLSGDPAVIKGLAPWLEGESAPLTSVMTTSTGVSFALDPTRHWQTMIMIKPLRSGFYTLPWLVTRGEAGTFSYTQEPLGFRVE